jgi:recombination DNA repair RAD52 pathway protein
MTESMPGPVREAVRVYLAQQSRRSLRRLANDGAQHGIKASIATLKRWSQQYGWQRRVAEHDRAVTEQSMAMTVDQHTRAMQAHFKLLDVAKRRCESLFSDEHTDVTPAKRKRWLQVTTGDYLRILKIEHELYERLEMLQAKRSAEPERPTSTYTDEELDVMLRALTRHRHGLPGS